MKTHAFLRLIRYKNLIMMALMMLMMKLCVIDPIIHLFNLTPTFTYLDFIILTLAKYSWRRAAISSTIILI